MRNIKGRHAYGCVALETMEGSHGGHHLPVEGRRATTGNFSWELSYDWDV